MFTMAETKEFKAESKRLLEMMINSIYTHKEIFLRELISNASDAMDKLYFKSMSENTGITRSDMAITIEANKDDRKLIITDNGIGPRTSWKTTSVLSLSPVRWRSRTRTKRPRTST